MSCAKMSSKSPYEEVALLTVAKYSQPTPQPSRRASTLARTPKPTAVWSLPAKRAVFLFFAVGCFFQPVARAQAKEVRRVVIFYELGLSSPRVELVDQGIRAALQNSPYQIELYSEYLETTLFPAQTSQEEFRQWYVHKYQNLKPDLLIAAGPSPLRFLVDAHAKYFSGIPVVFCGSFEEQAEHPQLDSQFTGVWEKFEAAKTLEAALLLQPGTKHVVVVGGTTSLDRHYEALVKEDLGRYTSRFDITYLTDLTMPELLERLKHLPEHTVVLLTDVAQDAAGTTFVGSTQATPMLASAANAPLFAIADVDLGHGAVGGDVTSFANEGKLVGDIVQRVLKGERPQDIPIAYGANVYMFDWRALQHWHLQEARLPPGSIVFNRPPSFWQAYKEYILAGLFLLVVQTLAILALLWQRAMRRKTEEELRESQSRLQGIVESAMDAIIAIDEEQRIVVFNDAAEKMFRCEAKDAIGNPIDRFIPQRFHAAHREHIRHFSDAGTRMGTQGVLWALRADGEEFPIETSISQTAAGGKKLFTVIVRDVTERKRAEEMRFRHAAIVESTDDAIISLNQEGLITSWNNGATHMCGYTEAETYGRSISLIIPAELREQEDTLRKEIMSGQGEHYETVRLTKEGGRIDVSVTISPLRDWRGRIVGASTIARDITLTKMAEVALRESEERFRLIANAAPVMIWMSGPDKRCIYFNQPWLEFTGRSLQAELGDGWAEGVHADDLEHCLETYSQAFDARKAFRMEYRLRRNDGEYRWIFDHGVPRFNLDASFAGFIGSCIDVTQRKQAEEALSGVSRRLIEAHEEERTWIARELHDDFNQRVALLATMLERVKQDLPAAEEAARRGVEEASQHVTELGSDIQAMSHRLHSSKLEYLGLEPASVGFCREFSERQHVGIDFRAGNVPKSLSREISLCLFRVLQEALQNALKHSGSRHFQVSLFGSAAGIELTVQDAGSGFDPEKAVDGQGLGLTSMQERLKLVDGQLLIDSRLGHGTTIHARVPVRPNVMHVRASR